MTGTLEGLGGLGGLEPWGLCGMVLKHAGVTSASWTCCSPVTSPPLPLAPPSLWPRPLLWPRPSTAEVGDPANEGDAQRAPDVP